MGKHLDWKTKYNYIMRYKNGESPTKLGREMQDLGLVDIKSNHRSAIQSSIYRWVKQFNNGGIDGLISKAGKNATGRPPKKDIHERYKDWSKEELLEHIMDMEDWFEKKGYGKKSFFEYIDLNTKHSISKLCKALEVSRSGYYKWVANGKKTTGNYDEELIEKIKFLFSYKKEVFGYRRIKVSLEREFGTFVNPNTVRRYMVRLGLKSKSEERRNKEN